MAGHVGKKRRNEHKTQRPKKKLRRAAHQREYHSDTESEQEMQHETEQALAAVNLLDSDDDIHNAKVDDGAPEAEEGSSSDEGPARKKGKKRPVLKKATAKESKAPEEEEEEEDGGDSEEEEEAGEEEEEEEEEEGETVGTRSKSKRNDPTAFATSLSKILSTKLSTSKRSDPVLARSAAAHEASKAAVDSALEAKAKRKLKEEKRVAMEKGRVRDVLLPDATAAPREGGDGDVVETTASEIRETERKLRKIAQRGVVKLFNAVRAAQVKAAEAERATRKEGVIGARNREDKVNELTKKGFLDLISGGGGRLKKGPLEEA